MAVPFAADVDGVALHKLFPAAFAATCRMIARDFLALGTGIVALVVSMVALAHWIHGLAPVA